MAEAVLQTVVGGHQRLLWAPPAQCSLVRGLMVRQEGPRDRELAAIAEAEQVELVVADADWPFAAANRDAIGKHFAALKSANPALFNGTLFMLGPHGLRDGMFRGELFRTDYASFLYWRDTGFSDTSVKNAFGSGALHGSDGALILGVMADHTANAGRIYPPSGSLDDDDLDQTDGTERIDVVRNIEREVAEETGLTIPKVASASWLIVDDGPRVAVMRRIDLAATGAELDTEITEYIARQAVPELSGTHVVTGPDDVVPGLMPPYTQAYIAHVFGA